MFGYVTPCKMELKIKDFEKFKAYYCGLCRTIKKEYGNLPRLALNYDMTFLAVLLDSLSSKQNKADKKFCCFHPLEKRVVFEENEALSHAAFFNVVLAYHKLLDNARDDKSIKSMIFARLLNLYLKKYPNHYDEKAHEIELALKNLYMAENDLERKSLDEYSHHFAELTGCILSSFDKDGYSENLYKLGYNLGKWIYTIDALDDLEKDLKASKFNPFASAYNNDNLDYSKLYPLIEEKANFILTSCAIACLNSLEKLPIKKNEDLLYNILQYGLMEKMDKVLNRKELSYHEKSL